MEWMVRDSIYGNIEVQEQVIIDLINSKEFQRLRRILQLGGGQFAFPSAVHNRFTHSLGVYYLIDSIFKNKNFNSLSQQDKLNVKIAGLLHDLGHGPFSHSFEGILLINHERWTVKIIQAENSEINQILKKHAINIEEVCSIINKTNSNNILLSLVSSQIDCDRMDYLLRDSYHTGVEYGNFDMDWIIQNIKIHQNDLVFDEKALFAIENYLLSRYHMYWQIYNHKVGLSFDCLLQIIFKRLKKLYDNNFSFKTDIKVIENILANKEMTLENYLQLDDYSLVTLFKCLMEEEDATLQDLANRIVNRNFFKVIDYNEVNISIYKEKLIKNGYDVDYYFMIKELFSPILYQRSQQEQAIKLINKDDQVFNLEDRSTLINIEQQGKKIKYILIPKEILVK